MRPNDIRWLLLLIPLSNLSCGSRKPLPVVDHPVQQVVTLTPTLTAKEQVEIAVFKHLIGQIKAKAIRDKATIILKVGESSDPSPNVIKGCLEMGVTLLPYSKSKELKLKIVTNKPKEFGITIWKIGIQRFRALVQGSYWCGPRYGTSSNFTVVFRSGIWKVTKTYDIEKS